MIVVDPRPTTFAKRAEQWLRVRPGTDQALALGLANLIIGGGTFDRAFLAQWSNGPLLVRDDTGRFLRERDLQPGGRDDIFFAMSQADGKLLAYDASNGAWVDSQPEPKLQTRTTVGGVDGTFACRTAFDLYAEAAAAYPPDRVAMLTGVEPDALARAAELIARASSVAYYAWNGVGQSVTATQTDRAIAMSLCTDRQLRTARRQCSRQRRQFRRHFRTRSTAAGTAGQSAWLGGSAAWPAIARMGDGARRLPRRTHRGSLIRCGCCFRSGPIFSSHSPTPTWRDAPWRNSTSTFTPTSFSIRRPPMPISCFRSQPRGSARVCVPASTRASPGLRRVQLRPAGHRTGRRRPIRH